MRPIQFLLILGLLASLLLYRCVFRSTIRDRLLVLGFLFTGLMAVLFPDYTSMLAEALGVGRGTDLVMYFFFVAGIFLAILFYAKIGRIERSQTELVRALAIATAWRPNLETSELPVLSTPIGAADDPDEGRFV
jgi:hypothetical protein